MSQKIVLGIMSAGDRGMGLAKGFAALSQAEIAYICDPDDARAQKAAAVVAQKQPAPPKTVRDFRQMLDDRAVDAVVIAAPDHWHAPATILACDAGKHVYVEKPGSHNPREGELMVAAARKHKRVVQMGNQRRSMPGVIEAVERVRRGEMGRVLWARGWYNNARPSIGRGNVAPVPDWLDWTLWQGPAPERPYRDNIVHYNWHWFWHWGTGELGNNGIHSLDICRWGLGVDCPLRVTAGGGKYHYDDDQETPDTHVVTYDFGDRGITWEGRNWHRRGFEGSTFGIVFYGEQGTLVIDGAGYRVYDPQNNEIGQGSGPRGDAPHLQNFLDAIASGARLNSDIEEGQKSTLLCHLGNIAYRTGRTIDLDPDTRRIVGDPEAAALWGREYRPGWEPKV